MSTRIAIASTLPEAGQKLEACKRLFTQVEIFAYGTYIDDEENPVFAISSPIKVVAIHRFSLRAIVDGEEMRIRMAHDTNKIVFYVDLTNKRED